VLADLERLGYACWPLIIPACAVDAGHRRERVWIVAHSERVRRRESTRDTDTAQESLHPPERQESASGTRPSRETLADTERVRSATGAEQSRRETGTNSNRRSAGSTVGDTDEPRTDSHAATGSPRRTTGEPSRWEPEPELGRVANGIPNRSHRLRGLGNAIVPQVAAVILDAMARTHNA
jgi:DNA (cytosine-5)-methyltransferase 1